MIRHSFRTLSLRSLLLLALFARQPAVGTTLLSKYSATVQQKLDAIDTEMSPLPAPIPCVPQAIGYSSRKLVSKDDGLSIEIHFPKAALIDLIVLMPAVVRNERNQLAPYAFPERFFLERILTDGTSEMIADHRLAPYQLTTPEPQLFPCSSIKPTSGIRITVTRTGKSKKVALGEIFAFAGPHNAALNAQVDTSKSLHRTGTWNPRYLVDGITQFLPVEKWPTSQKREYQVLTKKLVLIFDLGGQVVDEIRFWPILTPEHDISPFSSGIGFPSRITIDAFADTDHPLFSLGIKTPRPGSNAIIQRLPSTELRHLKLTLNDGFLGNWIQQNDRIALSEIELLNQGIPLKGITIVDIVPDKPQRSKPMTLLDQHTSEGRLLPVRPWLEKLARRQQLQRQRAKLQADLQQALQLEKHLINMLIATAMALILTLVLMVWIVRLLGIRRTSKMREQIAADLHDEIGANLSGIAHSAEIAKELIPNPDPSVSGLLDDAIQAARQTALDTRQFVRILEAKDDGTEVHLQIRKIAAQILGTIEYTCSLEESHPFSILKPALKWDFLFFVKEALNNIIKHAQADHVEIRTNATESLLRLTISDNGIGIAPDRLPLRHLAQRAKRLKGELTIKTTPEKGTHISLTLNRRKIK